MACLFASSATVEGQTDLSCPGWLCSLYNAAEQKNCDSPRSCCLYTHRVLAGEFAFTCSYVAPWLFAGYNPSLRTLGKLPLPLPTGTSSWWKPWSLGLRSTVSFWTQESPPRRMRRQEWGGGGGRGGWPAIVLWHGRRWGNSLIPVHYDMQRGRRRRGQAAVASRHAPPLPPNPVRYLPKLPSKLLRPKQTTNIPSWKLTSL